MPVATPARSSTVSLANLLENQFGNYVVQHAFNMSDRDRKRILFEKIEQAASEGHVARGNTYAKHVFSLINQASYELSMPAASKAEKSNTGASDSTSLIQAMRRTVAEETKSSTSLASQSSRLSMTNLSGKAKSSQMSRQDSGNVFGALKNPRFKNKLAGVGD